MWSTAGQAFGKLAGQDACVRQQILVTGATGFIGRALAAAWQAGGVGLDADVHWLVRDAARGRALGLPADRLRVGDLANPSGFVSTDLDQVLHLAGAVRALRDAEFVATNATATAALVRALPARCRVLYVSSLAAAGPSCDGLLSSAPPAACRPVSRYGASKLGGELAVAGAVPARSWLILRPCLVYGPGDAATELLFRQACAPLCAVPPRPRPLSTVHVRDVVAALSLALQRREVERACIPLGGELTDTHALLRAIAAAAGRSARLVPVPMAVAKLAGHAADLWSRLRGAPSFFSADKMREVGAPGWVVDREPARHLLGFTAAVSLHDGLAEVARARSGARE